MKQPEQVMLDTLLRRRTTRKFLKKDVPDEIVEQIVQMAMFAPTRLGKRPWHFVVLRDENTKKHLANVLRLSQGVVEAPVLIAVCADRRASETGDLDAAAATQNLLVAATALGLGSAWVAGSVIPLWEEANQAFIRAVRAPEDIMFVSLVALGYPAEEVPAHTEQEVYEQHRVHFERWGNTRG